MGPSSSTRAWSASSSATSCSSTAARRTPMRRGPREASASAERHGQADGCPAPPPLPAGSACPRVRPRSRASPSGRWR
eukprot:9447271-Alexandrium_andersonii.AAC.1